MGYKTSAIHLQKKNPFTLLKKVVTDLQPPTFVFSSTATAITSKPPTKRNIQEDELNEFCTRIIAKALMIWMKYVGLVVIPWQIADSVTV